MKELYGSGTRYPHAVAEVGGEPVEPGPDGPNGVREQVFKAMLLVTNGSCDHLVVSKRIDLRFRVRNPNGTEDPTYAFGAPALYVDGEQQDAAVQSVLIEMRDDDWAMVTIKTAMKIKKSDADEQC